MEGDPLQNLGQGPTLGAVLSGPFRRAARIHPRRGRISGWDATTLVPWSPSGFFHRDDIDPATRLDYHTGLAWPQDAASQLPVLMLDPRPGEVVVDCCAAPGSKTTQIGLALACEGLVIALDASAARRRILGETIARQGVCAAIVCPWSASLLARRFPGCAQAVLVDAPCSGHVARRARQLRAMAERQARILEAAACLVAPGGRLVYSTCTPYREENEDQIMTFLDRHRDWRVEPRIEPGTDPDLAGLGAVRCWPHRQGSEPFFACRLRAPADGRQSDLPFADMPPANLPREVRELLMACAIQNAGAGLRWCWDRDTVRVASAQAGTCCLPAHLRGLGLGSRDADHWRPSVWGAQWLIEQGALASVVDHPTACRLWAGQDTAMPPGLVSTEHGAPLAYHDGRRLLVPSRLRKADLR